MKPRSAVELAGENDRMTTTNSAVNGHLFPKSFGKAWTDCDRVERSTLWSHHPDIGQVCTATGTRAWPEFHSGRQLYDSREYYVCRAGDLIRQSAIRRRAPGYLSITIAHKESDSPCRSSRAICSSWCTLLCSLHLPRTIFESRLY